MVHGAVRHLFQLLGALTLALLVAAPLFGWRLTQGPVALDFLTPTLQAVLSARDGSYRVELDGTVLALGQGTHMLEIRALGVRAYAGGDQPVVTVPQVALTLNGRALLTGVLAPNAIRVHGLKVKLVRDENRQVLWAFGDQGGPDQSGGLIRGFLDALVGGDDPSRPGRYLQRAALVGADLVVEDRVLGLSWHAPTVDASFRRTATGLEAVAHLSLDLGGEAGMTDGRLTYRRDDDSLDGELRVAGIRPALLARLGGPLAGLSALDMPLSGSVRGHGTVGGGLSELAFDLSGEAGWLDPPAPLQGRTRVERATLRGRASDGLRQLRVDDLTLDLGGPTVTLTATAEGLGGPTTVAAEATARHVPFDSLSQLWPAQLAPAPREWVVGNLSKGMAQDAHMNMALHSPSGNFDDVVVDHLAGEIHADGVNVEYLHPMPAVRNAACVATFDTRDFRIALKGGEALGGLKVTDGLIVLGGLDQPDQTADIDLTIEGPVADALKLVDSEPLRYASALGLKPDAADGKAVTRLSLKFPLEKALKFDGVAIKAHSVLHDARLPDVLMGLDLSRGELVLDVDGKGMDVTGTAQFGTSPAHLQWRENFSKGAPFRSRYTVQAAAVDEALRRRLGLDGPPFVAPWIDGAVGITVTATVSAPGRADIEAKADLSPARMSLPGLGWHKEDRTTGGAEVTVRVDKGQVAAVPRFSVVAGDLQARGSVAFGPDGKASRVDFQKLAYGRTDLDGSIILRPAGGMDIAVKGSGFDAEPLLSSQDDSPRPHPKADLPPMSISAAVKAIWLSREGRLSNAAVTLHRDGTDWRSASIKGGIGDGKSFTATLQAAGPQRRAVTVSSDDAGSVLRAFDIYTYMVGGRLNIDASIDDSQESQPLSGVAHIADYNVVHAPVLARLLTVAALTGIVDVLRGEGIAFGTFEAPFTLTDGLLRVKDARATGPALGLTGEGEVDLDRGRMALEGTVVPMYALNSALGNLPLVGWLITGGEKGGGLVAFNYSMRGPTQDPDVMVNPLSALTPGFLRHLFNIFDNGSGTEARRKGP